MKASLHIEAFEVPLQRSLRIARGEQHSVEGLSVRLSAGVCSGEGETVGVSYRGETLASLRAQIESVREALEQGCGRLGLQALLPAGGARNALDCAFWALEAAGAGAPVHALAGLAPPRPLPLTVTLSLEAPDAMAEAARAAPPCSALKLKLGDAALDLARVEAVRRAAPHARLIVDVNEGWGFTELQSFAPALERLGVGLIEQPLPRSADAVLASWRSPIPLCADESCNDRADLETVAQRYQWINIKLEKTGGLTEALALAQAAQARGLPILEGGMLATSASVAPALQLGGFGALFDLDAPLYLAADRPPHLRIQDGLLFPPAGVWGSE